MKSLASVSKDVYWSEGGNSHGMAGIRELWRLWQVKVKAAFSEHRLT
jgi:hypothetical protein